MEHPMDPWRTPAHVLRHATLNAPSDFGIVAACQISRGARSNCSVALGSEGSTAQSAPRSRVRFYLECGSLGQFGIRETAVSQNYDPRILGGGGRCRLKKAPAVPKFIARFKRQDATRASSLVFCEKSTGVARFEVGYGCDIDSDIERTASLLAIQCLVRGCEPCDYAILVPAEKALAVRVTDRAKELLDAGMALANPALSPRQTEILRAVVHNSSNKEIAAKLNITVRTVKFHVSTLLNKFDVGNRVELARKAASVLRSEGKAGESFEADESAPSDRRESLGPITLDPISRQLAKKTGNGGFAQRVLSA